MPSAWRSSVARPESIISACDGERGLGRFSYVRNVGKNEEVEDGLAPKYFGILSAARSSMAQRRNNVITNGTTYHDISRFLGLYYRVGFGLD